MLLQKWIPGIVVKINGPLYYLMKLSDGRLARTHIDNIRQRYTSSSMRNNPNYDLYYPDLPRTVTNIWFEFVTNAS